MTIYEKLSKIQAELKAPKNQYNSYGGFNYRSCEDILQAVKQICQKYYTVLLLSDDLNHIGDRYYVKARAELIDLESGGSIATYAYAREELEKKGMDGSQITGASSSYARKYALNGLFCIDDVKDSDFTNQGEKPKDEPPKRKQWPDSVVEGQPKQCPLICIDCGAEVSEKVRSFSMSKWGKCYCMDCQKKYAGR